ncbi:MAG: hypothetical protein ACP5NA_07745 [Candidatus Acidulodesulfobacterium sp.]
MRNFSLLCGGNPLKQTIKINAVFNPKTETISGSEIINYAVYNSQKKYIEKIYETKENKFYFFNICKKI